MAQARRKRRKTTPARASRPIPGWVWMFAGLLIGLGIAAVLYLQGADRSPDIGALFGEPEPPAERAPAAEPERLPTDDEPRFRYYELLPEDEVRVPRGEREVPQDQVVPPPASPAEGDPVILQIGSFRRFEQADEMKARISLLGLSPQVHEVEIEGDTWHRVFVGPFTQEDDVNRALDRLRSENIEALRLRHRDG
ncbi:MULTISPECIES: SPOR domain-containing protein [unclassified Thioalkalivibrio]|uniref:SPOR domain-containing protein n=1 Tax=unclassified Thioalkalivibrio TaxID=2621013 RepID=UPI00037E684E|nr:MULTISPECIES: SPOR domain-containing protein [unclassified Thioalkalivibrio]